MQEAKVQYEIILEMVAALDCDYERLQELRDSEELPDDENVELCELENQAGECNSEEEARERIQEYALSVEVRSSWQWPGETLEPSEFRIVLCTGGPHVQIRGELNEHNEPYRAWLEYCDWGTPMQQYFDADQEILLSYARCFYFGD